jgi:hypothetical protein
MTAVADTLTEVTAPDSEVPVAEEAVSAEPKPRLTREIALAAVEAAFTKFADQVILARRLTVGTHNVQSGDLCESGTIAFMVKGHLQRPTRSVHPRSERPEEALASEERIRVWVRAKMDGALEDYTATGLMRQVTKIEAAQQKWHDEFRNLIIENFKSGYIKAPRMAEVMPQLGMEPYEPRMYASVSMNVDWHAPASNFGGVTINSRQMGELLREKVAEALRQVAGEGHEANGCNYGIQVHNIRVGVDAWQH